MSKELRFFLYEQDIKPSSVFALQGLSSGLQKNSQKVRIFLKMVLVPLYFLC